MRRAARQEPKEEKAKVVQVKDLRIDCESRRVFIGDREINLTAKEFDVLDASRLQSEQGVQQSRTC